MSQKMTYYFIDTSRSYCPRELIKHCFVLMCLWDFGKITNYHLLQIVCEEQEKALQDMSQEMNSKDEDAKKRQDELEHRLRDLEELRKHGEMEFVLGRIWESNLVVDDSIDSNL